MADSPAFLLETETLSQFLFRQSCIILAFFLLFATLFPGVWHAQLALGWGRLLLAFLVFHLFGAFFEFFFHRYTLHLAPFSFLALFHRAHAYHHGLTPVKPKEKGAPVVPVVNRYPITTHEQRDKSTFPWWSPIAFLLIFSPGIFLFQYLFPSFPFLIAGYIGVFVAYIGYEVVHGFEHRSYQDWWKPRIEGRASAFWRRAYSFHLMHHANVLVNDAVFGFLGFPVADIVFHTYKHPSTLFIHESMVPQSEFDRVRPVALIRFLDSKLFALHKKAPQ